MAVWCWIKRRVCVLTVQVREGVCVWCVYVCSSACVFGRVWSITGWCVVCGITAGCVVCCITGLECGNISDTNLICSPCNARTPSSELWLLDPIYSDSSSLPSNFPSNPCLPPMASLNCPCPKLKYFLECPHLQSCLCVLSQPCHFWEQFMAYCDRIYLHAKNY